MNREQLTKGFLSSLPPTFLLMIPSERKRPAHASKFSADSSCPEHETREELHAVECTATLLLPLIEGSCRNVALALAHGDYFLCLHTSLLILLPKTEPLAEDVDHVSQSHFQ